MEAAILVLHLFTWNLHSVSLQWLRSMNRILVTEGCSPLRLFIGVETNQAFQWNYISICCSENCWVFRSLFLSFSCVYTSILDIFCDIIMPNCTCLSCQNFCAILAFNVCQRFSTFWLLMVRAYVNIRGRSSMGCQSPE